MGDVTQFRNFGTLNISQTYKAFYAPAPNRRRY